MRDTQYNARKQTSIKFNQGRALLHLAGMYPRLLEVVLELVQNALDKDVEASRIWITINYKTRHLAVRDNGAGASIDKFNGALASVAERGRKGEGSLGQFGIGLISPLGKCERFTFISCPSPHKYGFQEWTFETRRITGQKEFISIPFRARQDLTLDETVPAGKTRVQWRSEMSLINFTSDNFISRIPIDELIGGIQDRYAATMRRNKTVISVEITDKDGHTERRPNVTAPDFRGRPLPEQTLENKNAGKTMFRLFVAPKTAKGRNGRMLVGVMGNDFRFPFHYLARTATELLKEEVVTALSSGLFEGEILCEKAKLHPSRKSFEKDDAFLDMCVAIEEWFDQFGSRHLAELQQSNQEQRFEELGQRSMKVLEHLLKNPVHAGLLEVIKSFRRGTVGEGHTEISSQKVAGGQTEPALSIEGKHGVLNESPSSEPRDRKEPTNEKKSHMPKGTLGPHGRPRKIVRGSNQGLWFAHEAMEGSPELWKLDANEGVLTFNIRHQLWRACDVKDTTLMKLQECVAMQALTLHMMPENLRTHQRQVLDEFNYSLVSWILNGDKARGTSPGRKASPPAKDKSK